MSAIKGVGCTHTAFYQEPYGSWFYMFFHHMVQLVCFQLVLQTVVKATS